MGKIVGLMLSAGLICYGVFSVMIGHTVDKAFGIAIGCILMGVVGLVGFRDQK
jgi:hypothetical protein